MKKAGKLTALLALAGAVSFAGCGKKTGDEIKLTVWVSEADQGFAKEIAEAFQKANPNKTYRFVFGVQGENEAATRVLNDVESAADVFSFPNDQLTQLVNGDALTRIGGDRLQRLKAQNPQSAVIIAPNPNEPVIDIIAANIIWFFITGRVTNQSSCHLFLMPSTAAAS